MVTRRCAVCGGWFCAKPSRVHRQPFCSLECYRKHLRQPAKLRYLRADDVIPPGIQPGRYRSASGYIRLRWRISEDELVEYYEHRWIMGLGPDDPRQVHHKNGKRDDNRLENLAIVAGISEHLREHHGPSWDVDEAMQLYAAGMGFIGLAQRYGLHPVTVMRALKRRGLKPRPQNRWLHFSGASGGHVGRLRRR